MTTPAPQDESDAHRIDTMLVDFAMDRTDREIRDPEDLAWQVRQELLPAVEAALSAFDGEGVNARIDEIEIDFGDLPGALDWVALRHELRDRLVQAIQGRLASQARDATTDRDLQILRSNTDDRNGVADTPDPTGLSARTTGRVGAVDATGTRFDQPNTSPTAHGYALARWLDGLPDASSRLAWLEDLHQTAPRGLSDLSRVLALEPTRILALFQGLGHAEQARVAAAFDVSLSSSGIDDTAQTIAGQLASHLQNKFPSSAPNTAIKTVPSATDLSQKIAQLQAASTFERTRIITQLTPRDRITLLAQAVAVNASLDLRDAISAIDPPQGPVPFQTSRDRADSTQGLPSAHKNRDQFVSGRAPNPNPQTDLASNPNQQDPSGVRPNFDVQPSFAEDGHALLNAWRKDPVGFSQTLSGRDVDHLVRLWLAVAQAAQHPDPQAMAELAKHSDTPVRMLRSALVALVLDQSSAQASSSKPALVPGAKPRDPAAWADLPPIPPVQTADQPGLTPDPSLVQPDLKSGFGLDAFSAAQLLSDWRLSPASLAVFVGGQSVEILTAILAEIRLVLDMPATSAAPPNQDRAAFHAELRELAHSADRTAPGVAAVTGLIDTWRTDQSALDRFIAAHSIAELIAAARHIIDQQTNPSATLQDRVTQIARATPGRDHMRIVLADIAGLVAATGVAGGPMRTAPLGRTQDPRPVATPVQMTAWVKHIVDVLNKVLTPKILQVDVTRIIAHSNNSASLADAWDAVLNWMQTPDRPAPQNSATILGHLLARWTGNPPATEKYLNSTAPKERAALLRPLTQAIAARHSAKSQSPQVLAEQVLHIIANPTSQAQTNVSDTPGDLGDALPTQREQSKETLLARWRKDPPGFETQLTGADAASLRTMLRQSLQRAETAPGSVPNLPPLWDAVIAFTDDHPHSSAILRAVLRQIVADAPIDLEAIATDYPPTLAVSGPPDPLIPHPPNHAMAESSPQSEIQDASTGPAFKAPEQPADSPIQLDDTHAEANDADMDEFDRAFGNAEGQSTTTKPDDDDTDETTQDSESDAEGSDQESKTRSTKPPMRPGAQVKDTAASIFRSSRSVPVDEHGSNTTQPHEASKSAATQDATAAKAAPPASKTNVPTSPHDGGLSGVIDPNRPENLPLDADRDGADVGQGSDLAPVNSDPTFPFQPNPIDATDPSQTLPISAHVLADILDMPPPENAESREAIFALALEGPGVLGHALGSGPRALARVDRVIAILGDARLDVLVKALKPGLSAPDLAAIARLWAAFPPAQMAPELAMATRWQFALLVADGDIARWGGVTGLVQSALRWLARETSDMTALAQGALRNLNSTRAPGADAGLVAQLSAALRDIAGTSAQDPLHHPSHIAPSNADQPARASSDATDSNDGLDSRADGSAFTQTAGLVLFNPYLPTLFNRLDLLNGPQFRDESSVNVAMDALHQITHGDGPAGLGYRPLERLMCNVAGQISLRPPQPLEPKMAETVDSLITSVLAQWRALSGTSVEGFKETFIRREGILTQREDSHLLSVSPQPFDMLLDSLPWTIGIVKFTGMDKPLHVNWRGSNG